MGRPRKIKPENTEVPVVEKQEEKEPTKEELPTDKTPYELGEAAYVPLKRAFPKSPFAPNSDDWYQWINGYSHAAVIYFINRRKA